MPLVQISLLKDKPAEYRRAISDNVYRAMIETFDVPDDDKFQIITEHEADDLIYDKNYLGIERTDDILFIRLTVNDTRTLEQKKALYKRIAELLAENPGIRPQDVLINLVEVAKENWSFGNGEAQYAEK